MNKRQFPCLYLCIKINVPLKINRVWWIHITISIQTISPQSVNAKTTIESMDTKSLIRLVSRMFDDSPRGGYRCKGSISHSVCELINQICENTCCSCMKNNDESRSQFCTCHDSSAVVACVNVWSGWLMRTKHRAKIIFTTFCDHYPTSTLWNGPQSLQLNTELVLLYNILPFASARLCSVYSTYKRGTFYKNDTV